ncbi:hypothetical protein N7G274_009095 [Stereocaulon virgatum]|uniref:Nucleolar 27S pre-rRNA processing Urb2/Npa2 C-terminal domain-containing protein n=1 Tax=Stereocaulon virgatum TaxID=373712 RepID=A0ABR4A1C5_9LECA
MAATTSSEGVSRQQRSILTLDKSDEPFEVLIAHACNILDIDINDDWNDFSKAGGWQALRVNTTCDPRPEWTLKWLLKKFKAAEEELASPCLYSKAWSLLRELTVRLPLSKTASLLKTYDFITIVRNTLQWFYESVNRRLSAPNGEERGSLHSSANSSGTVSSSSSQLGTSRKRKRDGTEISISTPIPIDESGAVDALFMAVCATIAQVWSFTEDSDHDRGFTVEHIKSALRSSPQDAAQILGTSLYLTSHLLRKPNRASERGWSTTYMPQNYDKRTACRFYVSSAVKLWSTRSSSRQDPHDTESHLAFGAHCMMPALQLLNRCREWSSLEKNIEAVTDTLTEMLIKHVILPYRASKIDTETPGRVSTGGTSISFHQELVSVFRPSRLPLLGQANVSGGNKSNLERSIRKTDAQKTITLLSLLFDVALGSCPRSTPKLRRAEDAWLEQLFIEISECAALFLPSKVKRYHAMLVKWMMQKAVKHKLRLNSSTVEAILDETSGLFNRDTGVTVQWGVIDLCLQIDANVFIILGKEDLEEGKSRRIPNKYLLSLLSSITDGQLETSQDYHYVLSYIITPLCNAFADARDLGSFIDIWTEQLSIVLSRQTARNDLIASAPGIWEDEKLLRSVAQLVTTSLTSASMERIMSRAIDSLTMESQHMMNGRAVSPAVLVILDCLFAGISRADTMARLVKIGESAFCLSGISNMELSPQTGKWRIWRIKATIADRWFTLHKSPAFKRNAHMSIYAAFELIKLIPSKISANEKKDLSEAFHAFRFILRFVAKDPFWNETHFSSQSELAVAVSNILDAMEPFCRRTSHDHFQTIKLPETVPRWDEFAVNVTSIDTLYLGCVADILTSPGILSHLDANVQARLIEQLYWCAVYQQRLSQSMPVGSIDYSWPWKMLHHPDVIGENASTTKYLRNFQVDHYLSTSKFGEPKCWDIEMADYVTGFKSIQMIPVQCLERGYRSVIANRILRILLHANFTSLAIAAEHLTMLAKLLTMPNKSMDILENAEESRKGLVETGKGAVLIRLARGVDCTMGWSEDKMYAVSALKTLTSSVMSHLFTTLNQRSSMDYLKVLYHQLAGLLEDTHDNKINCSTALAAVIEISLNAYSKHNDNVGESLGILTESLKTTRSYHLESLLHNFEEISITGASDQKHRLGVILECLASYADLLGDHPNLGNISHKLFGADGLSGTLKRESRIHQGENVASDRLTVDGYWLEYLTTRLARVELLLNARDSKMHPNIVETSAHLYQMKFAREKNNLLNSLRKIMPTLSPQSKAQVCFGHNLEVDRCLSYAQVYLLGMAIVSMKDQEIEEFRESISRTFTLLCRGLFQPILFRDCMLTMQCISLLLQKHPRLITQWNIDNLLAAITAKSANLEQHIEDKQSPMLYIGLCRLFSTILTTHRTKTGRRYHLLLLALQSLLRCLFTPYTPTSPSPEPHSAFTATHASAYARLLTTLCDPTPSSLSRASRNRTHLALALNDETKKAKSIAGQHLPYLIMEYCTCQLKGRLEAEMKVALEVGLFAVVGVMGVDVMRTMNAALGEGGRGVWKALYGDFRRAGGRVWE